MEKSADTLHFFFSGPSLLRFWGISRKGGAAYLRAASRGLMHCMNRGQACCKFTPMAMWATVAVITCYSAFAEEAAPCVHQEVSQEPILGHSLQPSSWPTYGGQFDQTRFSPLTQVNTTNVHGLEPAWITRLGLYSPESGYETSPIVYKNAVILTTPVLEGLQWVVKLDARSGVLLWRKALPIGTTTLCCGGNNRGAAIAEGRIFLTTADAKLVALDMECGEVVWTQAIADPQSGYSCTGAPLAYEGRVFTGVSGGEFGIRGFLRAYDAHNGQELWTWHTTVAPDLGGWEGDYLESAPGSGISLGRNIAEERQNAERYRDSWMRGGGGIWVTPAFDPKRDTLYVSVGNPSPDFDGQVRPGDNRWTSSLCALNATTGKLVWGFQYLPHDVWDYGGGAPPILASVQDGDTLRDVVGLFTKLGYFYLLDRDTGQLVRKPMPYVPHENFLSPPTQRGVLVAPGVWGGTSWSPASYDSNTGLFISANSHWPTAFTTLPTKFDRGSAYLGGATFDDNNSIRRRLQDEGELTMFGSISAIDPIRGSMAWEVRTRLPLIGGVCATAGGLVFCGEADGTFNAWDSRTGKSLWNFKSDAGCNAPPVTFLLGDKQYVLVVCGGSTTLRNAGLDSQAGANVICFSLPG